MSNTIVGSSAPRGLPKPLRRILLGGLAAGSLLGVCAGLLPAPMQNVAAWIGLGLMFACLVAMVAYLARDTRLEWRGLSPLVAIVIGALAYGGPSGWYHLAQRGAGGSRSAPGKPAHEASHAVTTARTARPTQALNLPRQASHPAARTSGAPSDLEQALAEITSILDEQARPAFSEASQASFVLARATDPGSLGPELADATRLLTELQASLNRVRSEHTSVGSDLDAILGDTAAVEELGSALERTRGSLESLRETGAAPPAGAIPARVQAATALRSDAWAAQRWITDCQRRIAERRASASAGWGRGSCSSLCLERCVAR